MMIPQKGDLVYLPSDIMIFGAIDKGGEIHNWMNLDEPTYGVMVTPNYDDEHVYHKIHVKGGDWFVRTIDTMEVVKND